MTAFCQQLGPEILQLLFLSHYIPSAQACRVTRTIQIKQLASNSSHLKSREVTVTAHTLAGVKWTCFPATIFISHFVMQDPEGKRSHSSLIVCSEKFTYLEKTHIKQDLLLLWEKTIFSDRLWDWIIKQSFGCSSVLRHLQMSLLFVLWDSEQTAIKPVAPHSSRACTRRYLCIYGFQVISPLVGDYVSAFIF